MIEFQLEIQLPTIFSSSVAISNNLIVNESLYCISGRKTKKDDYLEAQVSQHQGCKIVIDKASIFFILDFCHSGFD